MNSIRILNSLVAGLLILLGQTGVVYAKNLGVVGATYHIVEKDALKEIEDKAKQVNWGEAFSRKEMEKRIKVYKPKNLKPLVRAEKDRTFTVDMTYTLQYDIPDGKGGILYPKGYTFNPLDYIDFPKTLVVLNGADIEQVSWFKNSEYYKDYRVMLLITDGPYYELSRELERPVFYLNEAIVNRFQLRAVPSVIKQEGRLMEVSEVDIGGDKKKSS